MTQEEKESIYENFYKDFITVGELREMLEPLGDDELITVSKGNGFPNHKITHIDDTTAFGFWELRIDYDSIKDE